MRLNNGAVREKNEETEGHSQMWMWVWTGEGGGGRSSVPLLPPPLASNRRESEEVGAEQDFYTFFSE